MARRLITPSPAVRIRGLRRSFGPHVVLDDLDLDLARSVVVIEWGRGMAEDLAESWWDIELERPVGASGDDIDPSELDADAPRFVTITRGVR